MTRDDAYYSELTQLTPYFIWSNFETTGDFASEKYGEELKKDFGTSSDEALALRAKNVTLPTTTPNCLTNALYGVLDLKRNAERTLLEKVCSEVPILTPFYLGGHTPTGATITDYEFLNYDLLYGKQYWLK